ncbi:monosaccharide-transporting ATPase [Clostridia bacterium]|nr:monosaccharide-transporting ATPase [Clostridia bacterium]
MDRSDQTDLLSMTGITKSFFGVTVLDHVDLRVHSGEVHALLGENGAGKSTLMNILGGVLTPDSGDVTFGGKPLGHGAIKESENAGIAFVHQELNLFNDLTVYENIFLRKELTGALGSLRKREMARRAGELFNRLGVSIDPYAMVSELETSKKQQLEIAKALFANARLLILDEPTTSLNQHETEHLFSILRRLKAEGKSFIFISHKMNEIFEIADRYTVLNNGRVVGSGLLAETNPRDVTRMMIGGKLVDEGYYQKANTGEVVLRLNDLAGEGFSGVNLPVHAGEVVAFTGLKGAGVSEILQTMFGAMPIRGGSMELFGKTIKRQTIGGAMRSGLAMIAANRKENSILPDLAMLDNLVVSEHALTAKRQIIRRKREVSKYNTLRDDLSIRANDPFDLITSLSGGNQQKVILARWLNTKPRILLMDNPTQGIDVGAKAEIYKLIRTLAGTGITILFHTLEIPEIQKVADRCVVFFHGKMQADLPREEITEERVMLYATGAAADHDQVKGVAI